MQCAQCSLPLEESGQVYVVGDMGPELISLLEQSLGPAFNKSGQICSQCFCSITKLLPGECADSDDTLSVTSSVSIKSELQSDDDSAAPGECASVAPVVRASDAPVVRFSAVPVVRASAASVDRASALRVVRASDAPVDRSSAVRVVRVSDAPVVHASAAPVVCARPAPVVRASDVPVDRASAVRVVRASDAPVVRASAVRVVRASDAPVVRASAVRVVRASDAPMDRASAVRVVRVSAAPVMHASAAPVARTSDVRVVRAIAAPVARASAAPVVCTGAAQMRDSRACGTLLSGKQCYSAAPVVCASAEPVVRGAASVVHASAAQMSDSKACGKSLSGKQCSVAIPPKQIITNSVPNGDNSRPPNSPPPRARIPEPPGFLRSPMRKRPKNRPLDSNEKTIALNIYKFIERQTTTYPYRTDIIKQVAEVMGTSFTAISRIMREYKKTGRVRSPPPRKPRKKLVERDLAISEKVKKIVHRFDVNNETITVDKVLAIYRQDVSLPKLSRSTMYHVLRTLKVTFKKPVTLKTKDNEQ